MKSIITEAIKKITGVYEVELDIPENEEHGDYSSNIALTMFSKSQITNSKLQTITKFQTELKKFNNPRQLAEEIVKKLKEDKELMKFVDKIEVAGPGFINFYLSKDALLNNLIQIDREKVKYGRTDKLLGKKYLIEHTSPNTIKTLHVGHVRNNITGMTVHNILEFCSAKVALDVINNDRGIHVMKAVWAYMKFGEGKTPENNKEKPDHFVDKFYIMGVKSEENEDNKLEMRELLRKWEANDSEVRDVWKKLRDWILDGFQETYKRLGSHHDHQWFESDFFEQGKEMVEEGLKKGVFRKLADGAVLSDLSKYDLSDAIVLRADGTSMYHTQDLYLTKLKRQKFPSDLYIWCIGPEQQLYLKQLFAMCEQLGIGKISDYMHMWYGFVYLKGKGKMSSRAGNVISADTLIDEVVKKARKVIDNSETHRGLNNDEKDKVAEEVGMGAIKYGFLKMARETDVQFDIDESLSLEGNSGPYLQYTFARTQSVLNKVKSQKLKVKSLENKNSKLEINNEEASLLRSMVHFPEIVEISAKNYAPNLICNYLYDIASKFNKFYNLHRILDADELKLKLRLKLTQATGQILKNGLGLLGIEAPQRM